VPGEPYARLDGVGRESVDGDIGDCGTTAGGGRMLEHGVAGLPKVLQRAALAVVEECAIAKARSSEGDRPDLEGDIRSIGGRLIADLQAPGELLLARCDCAWSDSARDRGVVGEFVLFSTSDFCGLACGTSEISVSRHTSGFSVASSGVKDGIVDAESLYLCIVPANKPQVQVKSQPSTVKGHKK
jgi:hypothetical protein